MVEPLLSQISPASATLTWRAADAPSTATRPVYYRIESREPPSSSWYPLASRLTATTYDLHFLHPDQDYMFRLVIFLQN